MHARRQLVSPKERVLRAHHDVWAEGRLHEVERLVEHAKVALNHQQARAPGGIGQCGDDVRCAFKGLGLVATHLDGWLEVVGRAGGGRHGDLFDWWHRQDET